MGRMSATRKPISAMRSSSSQVYWRSWSGSQPAGKSRSGGAADHRRPPVQHCLVLVLPVRAAHELPILGLDVPTPDLVGVVDVGVAVEDGERLGDALLPVRAAHGVPPRVGMRWPPHPAS